MAWERPSHLIVDQQAPPMGIHDDVACTDVAVQDRRVLLRVGDYGLSNITNHLDDGSWAGLIEVSAEGLCDHESFPR